MPRPNNIIYPKGRTPDKADKYASWKAEVDRCIERLTGAAGFTSDWLPDYNYVADFDKRATPESTARRAIKAARSY